MICEILPRTPSPSTPNRRAKFMNQNQTESKQPSVKESRNEGLDETTCCVSYSSLPLESDATFKTRAWTYKFPDGRKVTASIAEDGSDEGMWFRIARPMEEGKESELKFRLSLEAAAVLSQLIDYALDFHTTLDVVARRRRSQRAKRTRELIRRCHPRRVRRSWLSLAG